MLAISKQLWRNEQVLSLKNYPLYTYKFLKGRIQLQVRKLEDQTLVHLWASVLKYIAGLRALQEAHPTAALRGIYHGLGCQLRVLL